MDEPGTRHQQSGTRDQAHPWPFTHRLDVRFRDCDAMGHVNHAVYFTYLEQTRFACWRSAFGAGATVEASGPGISFILVRAECDFRGQLRFGDELEVRLKLAALGRSSFTFDYEIARTADGLLAATARTVQVMYDYGRKVKVPIPEGVRQELGRLATG
jgi:acyl-CoA thioester hydrolase